MPPLPLALLVNLANKRLTTFPRSRGHSLYVGSFLFSVMQVTHMIEPLFRDGTTRVEICHRQGIGIDRRCFVE